MTKADKEGQRKTPILRFKGFTDYWEQRKLGKVATFINGRAYKQNELLDSGKYKVLRVGNFYTNDSWYYSNLELADKYYIDKGDLVYTWSATFGPHIWNGEKVIYHYHIWKIELSKFLDRDFTLQILEADKAKLLANTNGSTMIHVTKKDMESKVIPLPIIEEQKQIGLYLTKFDTLIALYERKLKLLSRVKKYFLDNLFAEKKYPNLRFKGFTNVWEKIKLKDTQTTLTDGNYANLYPKPTDMTDADKGIPFLTGGNLKDGILDLKNAKYITKEKHSQLKSGHLEEDDIVIAVRGSLGELGYVTKQNIDWNINSQLAIIRTSKNELIGNFLLYFFLSSKGKSKLLSRQTGTALKQLPLQQLKTIVIPKTLLLEQQKISNILKTIDKTISFYKDKQQHLTEIKKALLNTMFI